jgi:hypothetical protein
MCSKRAIVCDWAHDQFAPGTPDINQNRRGCQVPSRAFLARALRQIIRSSAQSPFPKCVSSELPRSSAPAVSPTQIHECGRRAQPEA